MTGSLHHRFFAFTIVWTLGLLLLGSVVHATESSLACPDWPTCFGTMMPEMTGGVFWEHLHRLVAGGLILLFGAATLIARRDGGPQRNWVQRLCLVGLALLVVQSVFGGLTVIFRLPDAISTTHLGLAFIFLSLTVILAVATSPHRESLTAIAPDLRDRLARWGTTGAVVVFVQSVLGAYVRHSDAGMACGTGLLCNGGLVPPGFSHLVGVQYLHRLLAIVAATVVVAAAITTLRRPYPSRIKRVALGALVVVLAQVTLGFISTATILAVLPVSFHTLLAATLLALLVALAAWGRLHPTDAEVGADRGEHRGATI